MKWSGKRKEVLREYKRFVTEAVAWVVDFFFLFLLIFCCGAEGGRSVEARELT